jgi:tartrate-resistant acid phosphatase type 5
MLKPIALTLLFLLFNIMSGLLQDEADKQSAILTPQQSKPVRFAVIGDYGNGSRDVGRVASLVKSWRPEFIATMGDNNYAGGKCCKIDKHVGKFYHEYIFPYRGVYGRGARINRFFPTLGDHDWREEAFQSYLDYFTLPGNERYYDVAWGPVHLFILNSNNSEPDGNSATSVQANWLRERLAASTEPWKLVFLHHPPFSSGSVHGSRAPLRWPFRDWGATAVFSANDHLYERLFVNDLPYFVNGLGGVSKYAFENPPIPESQIRYNENYGAQRVTANNCAITFEFYAVGKGKTPIDSYTINRCPAS